MLVGPVPRTASTAIQASMAAHVATKVVSMTTAALWPAVSAEPPLKAYHPGPAPSSVAGRLCGRLTCPHVIRRPRTRAIASAAAPAFMSTAVPPAKSMAPSVFAIHPPRVDPSSESNANTQWATGK